MADDPNQPWLNDPVAAAPPPPAVTQGDEPWKNDPVEQASAGPSLSDAAKGTMAGLSQAGQQLPTNVEALPTDAVNATKGTVAGATQSAQQLPSDAANALKGTFAGMQDTGQKLTSNIMDAAKSAASGMVEDLNPESASNKAAGPIGRVGNAGAGILNAGKVALSPITGLTKTAADEISGPMAGIIKSAGEWLTQQMFPDSKAPLPTQQTIQQNIQPDVTTALGAAIPVKGAGLTGGLGAAREIPTAPIPGQKALPPPTEKPFDMGAPSPFTPPPISPSPPPDGSVLPDAPKLTTPRVDARGKTISPDLLPPSTPHDLDLEKSPTTGEWTLPNNAPVGAATISPLEGLDPQAIQDASKALKEVFATPHMLEQGLEEQSAHHMAGELGGTNGAPSRSMNGILGNPGQGAQDIAGAFVQRQSNAEAGERLSNILDQGLGAKDDLATIKRAERINQLKSSDPLYKRFESLQIQPTPEIKKLLTSPDGGETPAPLVAAGVFGKAKQFAALQGIPWKQNFFTTGAQKAFPTAQSWQLIKEALDSQIQDSYNNFGQATKRTALLQGIRNDLVDALDNHPNVGNIWKEARENYASFSGLKTARDLGDRLLTERVDPNELRYLTANFSEPQMAALRQQVRYNIAKESGRAGAKPWKIVNKLLAENNQDKLSQVINDDAVSNRFNQALVHEQEMTDSKNSLNLARVGSQTQRNLADAAARAKSNTLASKIGTVAKTGAQLLHAPFRTTGSLAFEHVGGMLEKSEQLRQDKINADLSKIWTMQNPEARAILPWIYEHGETYTGAPNLKVVPRAAGGNVTYMRSPRSVPNKAGGGGTDAATADPDTPPAAAPQVDPDVQAAGYDPYSIAGPSLNSDAGASAPTTAPAPEQPTTDTDAPKQVIGPISMSKPTRGGILGQVESGIYHLGTDDMYSDAVQSAKDIGHALSSPENFQQAEENIGHTLKSAVYDPIVNSYQMLQKIESGQATPEEERNFAAATATQMVLGGIAPEAEVAEGAAAAGETLGSGMVRKPPSKAEATPEAFQPLSETTSLSDHPDRISQRIPTAKQAIEVPGDDARTVSLDAMKATPELYEHNVNLVRDYPGANIPKNYSTDKAADTFINNAADNLVWLHNKVPPDIRARSSLWYDGGNKIANDFAQKYGVTDSQAAGVIAAMSPQKDWYNNVSLAQRVLHVLKGGGDNFNKGFVFSPEMDVQYQANPSLMKYPQLYNQIKDKTLSDIDQTIPFPKDERAILKAMWVRLHDQAHADPTVYKVSPEGNTLPDASQNVAWGSLPEISKAVSIIDGDDISSTIGRRNKVRNFYNNILTPNSNAGDVTIDTHAVAAAQLRPFSGNATEVAHNFGNSLPKDVSVDNAKNSAKTGIWGTYPLYAEAYRRAADRLGIQPRQLQSIDWEAVQGLFPENWKNAKNSAIIDNIWRQSKKVGIDETRQRVLDAAGGRIQPPTWLTDEANERIRQSARSRQPGFGTGASNATAQNTGNAAELPGHSVYGAGTESAVPGTGSGTAREVAKEINEPATEATGTGIVGRGGVGSAPGTPEDAVATAQATAERVAQGRQKLAGLPDQPIKAAGNFVPGPVGYLHDIAEQYMHDEGLDYNPPKTYAPVDTARATKIAKAFDEMKHDPSDPRVKASYDALINETLGQYAALKQAGVKFEFIKPGMEDPYKSTPRMAAKDVVDNKHLWVYPTDTGFGSDAAARDAIKDNPLLAPTDEYIDGKRLLANDVFRIVHDMFGHFKDGNGFRAGGEENAWRSHSAMYSDEARPAMTAETRGQNSWLNYGPYGEKNRTASAADTTYADQKIGRLPDWVSEEGRHDPGGGGMTLGSGQTSGEVAPRFFSAVEQAINNAKTDKAPVATWLGMLRSNPAVKQSEMDWLGLEDWLKEKNGGASVPNTARQALADWKAARDATPTQPSPAPLLRAAYEEKKAGIPESGPAQKALADWRAARDATSKQGPPTDLIKNANAENAAAQKAKGEAARTPVDKQDILDYVRGNTPNVQEVEKGGDTYQKTLTGFKTVSNTKYGPDSGYNVTLPGGKNYRETLLTLPPKVKTSDWSIRDNPDAEGEYEVVNDKGRVMYGTTDKDDAQKYITDQNQIDARSGAFHSTHWEEPNVLAHVRHDDRVLNQPSDENIRDIAQRMKDAVGAKNPADMGSGAPDLAVKKGAVTPEEAAEFSRAARWQNQWSDKPGLSEKDLHLAEIQSDWAQKGAKEGYKEAPAGPEGWTVMNSNVSGRVVKDKDGTTIASYDEPISKFSDKDLINDAWNTYGNRYQKNAGVPDMPFKTNWHELALKRMIRYAAENGYDRLSWDTGKTNADRYNLSNKIDQLHWFKNTDGTFNISPMKDDAEQNMGAQTENLSPDKLESTVGKGIAQKIIDQSNDPASVVKDHPRGITGHGIIENPDLEVGGAFHKRLYDQKLPDAANKIGNKYGAKVEDVQIPTPRTQEGLMSQEEWDDVKNKPSTSSTTAHSIKITPELRKAAMHEGFSMFARGGAVHEKVLQRAAGGRVVAKDINHKPSGAQKASGVYKKDHLNLFGLDISIENAKGSVRSGVGKDGKKWFIKMPCSYGYIRSIKK